MDQVPGIQQGIAPLDQAQQQFAGQTPSSPTTLTAQPPSRKSKRIIFISAVIALILIISGLLFVFLSYYSKEPAESEVYKNKQYKFSITYPKGFEIQEYPELHKKNLVVAIYNRENEMLSISVAVGEKKYQDFDKSYGSYIWTKQIINELENLPNGTVKEGSSDTYTKRGEILLDKSPGIKYELHPKKRGKGIYSSLNIAMEKDNKTYLISAVSVPNNTAIFTSSQSANFDRVISTFKFN